MADRERAEKFLDEVASTIYPLLAKHGIKAEEFYCDARVSIKEIVTNNEAFKNVARGVR